jgi:Inner membrane component of T3SS, cytoplasmic domain
VGPVVQTATSRLVVLSPSGLPQGQFPLDREQVRVGRDPAADLPLKGTAVSWHHALLTRSGGRWFVRDLGSTNGTLVDGARISQPTEVGPGAHIAVGEFGLRFEGPSPAGAAHPPTQAFRPVPAGAGIGLRDQYGQQINNVEGNQYIQQQRESFFREVARTRTKARWFVWLGLCLVVGGLAAVLATILPFLSSVFGSVANQTEPDPANVDIFGRSLGGVPLFVVGYVSGLVGMLLVVVGIVLHVVATSRRRRVEERFPLPYR